MKLPFPLRKLRFPLSTSYKMILHGNGTGEVILKPLLNNGLTPALHHKVNG
jgi:hypothetical protein